MKVSQDKKGKMQLAREERETMKQEDIISMENGKAGYRPLTI